MKTSELSTEHINISYVDNVFIQVDSLNADMMTQLKSAFTIKKKNAQFMPQVKSGIWDGYIRFIWKNGIVPRGLLHELADSMTKLGIKGVVDPKLFVKPLDISDLEEVTRKMIEKQKIPMVPYEYQMKVVRKMLKSRRGIARAATSSGKTYMISILCNYLLEKKEVSKILVIVPSVDLVVQGYSDLQEYGYSIDQIGMFMGKTKDAEHPIVFSTWQSLQNITDDNFFKQFDMVIVDEAHKLNSGTCATKKDRGHGGTVIKQILDKCTEAEWRFGVTGTMPDDKVDQLTVIGCLGRVLVEVSANELMEKGFISQLKIICPMIEYKDKEETKKELKRIKENMLNEYLENTGIVNPDYDKKLPFMAERKFMEEHKGRTDYIASIIKECLGRNENVLVLVHGVDYGKQISDLFRTMLPEAETIDHVYGSVDVDIREKVKKAMETHTKCVIVATISIFATGISIKNLHNIILATGGKSKITTLQAIGRGLRLHESKEYARFYDIMDNLTYATKHASERVNYYEKEKFNLEFIEKEL